MRSSKLWAWLVFVLGLVYFAAPLIGTFEFSLRMPRGRYSFDAYQSVFSDPQFQATFSYSVVIGLATIVVGVLIIVPAVYFMRLRLPWLRPYFEFVILLPLIIPPIMPVFGYIRLYNSSSWLPFTGSALGTDLLLTFGFVTLGLPAAPVRERRRGICRAWLRPRLARSHP